MRVVIADDSLLTRTGIATLLRQHGFDVVAEVDIAANLYIAERTVETHTTQIFQKLGLHSSADVRRRVLAVLAYLCAIVEK